MSEEVTMWKCEDGATFSTKHEADLHEQYGMLQLKYNGHPLITYTETVGFNDFAKWLEENVQFVLYLISLIPGDHERPHLCPYRMDILGDGETMCFCDQTQTEKCEDSV